MDRVKKSTIVDVAAAANVSVATVSYVLSGKRSIGKETQARVRAAISDLDYRPNPNAQGLKATRNNLLSVLVTDWKETFVLPILRGVESIARDSGYHLMVNSIAEFDNDTSAAIDHLQRRAVDGVLFVSGIGSDDPLYVSYGGDLPVVGVNRPFTEDGPAILCDNVDGGYRAARHLLEAGCVRPAAIMGPLERSASRNRLEGFRRALNDEGIDLPDALVYRGDFEAPSGAEGLIALRAAAANVDGIFCANDHMAAGVVAKAIRTGLAIPDEIRLIGFDDQKVASLLPVSLTTFGLPAAEMAVTGTQTLIGMIEGDRPLFTRVLVRSKLTVRESTTKLSEN